MPLSAGLATAETDSLRLLCLGDSYTIGEGVDAAGRWPEQLASSLRNSGIDVGPVEIVAQTGWTTDELAGAMDRHAFDPPYDLVTLLIGVNNQYRAGQEPKCDGQESECRKGHGRPRAAPEGQGGPGGAAGQEPKCDGQESECRKGHGRPRAAPEDQGGPRGAGRDLDNYRAEFRALLQRAIALAGGEPARVVVVSIPDWGVTPFAHASGRDAAQVAREIDLYNAANAEIATALRVRRADVTPASRDGGGRADMLVGDGLHPSAAMYRRWLAAIEPEARAALPAR
jgi:lysophospholipase L1-like esterase